MTTTQKLTERDRYRIAFEDCIRDRVLPTPTNMMNRNAPGYHTTRTGGPLLNGRLCKLHRMLIRKYGFTRPRWNAHWQQEDWDLATLRLPEHPYTGDLTK